MDMPTHQRSIPNRQETKGIKDEWVLFVPEWKNADYWVEIFDTEGFLLWPFKFVETHRPFIIQNKLDHRSPLTGRTKFNFLAFFIEFDSN
jgi:hypothetical protein